MPLYIPMYFIFLLLYTRRRSCLGDPALSGSFDIRSSSATAVVYYNTSFAPERDEKNKVYMIN